MQACREAGIRDYFLDNSLRHLLNDTGWHDTDAFLPAGEPALLSGDF